MSNKDLQNKMATLVHEQLKEENATTKALVLLLLQQVSNRRNSYNTNQVIRKKLDEEIQKMLATGTLDSLEDEIF